MAKNSLNKKTLGIAFIVLAVLAIIFGLLNKEPNLLGSNHTSVTKLESSGNGDLQSYYQQSQDLAKNQSTKTTVTFLAVGDIMLSRNVAGSIAKARDPLLPFSKLSNLLKSTDFNFANLESPLSGNSSFNPTGSLVFNAPPAYTAGLTDNNFKILNLANNHAFDQGKIGLDYTKKFLDDNSIFHTGTGDTLDEAWQPAIVKINGVKIGFIGASYASVNDGGKSINNYVARIEDTQRLKNSINQLKQTADFIVVTMHAGTEYTAKPNTAQIKFAHAAIDAGADIVIGAHPHWVQSMEKYNGKYIFYSLGNFIFDQEFSAETKQGLTLKVTLESSKSGSAVAPGAAGLDDLQGTRLPATLKQIELIPIIIENYSTPRISTDTEAQNILKKIGINNRLLTP